MKEIADVKRFFGMEINQTKDYITISQRDHIEKLLEFSGLRAAKPRNTSMEPNTKYVRSLEKHSTKEEFKAKYRKLIGNLLYISQNTRPDITYSVNYLSRFQNNPNENHTSE